MEMSPEERYVAAQLAREDLYWYSRYMFKERNRYKWLRADHHRIICDALMRVYRGETKRLIINIPPRYSKTELAVVNFMSWALGKSPDSEFIHTSYSALLAATNAWKTRELISMPAYGEVFPEARLLNNSQASDNWRTTAGGVVYATGAKGTITGFGAGKLRPGFGGAIIIDDPHKPDEARSDTIRKGVLEWFQNTLESRTNSQETPIILIMQRLHEEDLAGWLLDGGNGEVWEHVCLPALREDGSALWPERHSIETLRRMQQTAPYTFSGQFQQRPTPPEGGMIKPDSIQIIDALPPGIIWVRAWDLAGTPGAGDWTVGVKIGRTPDKRIIIGDVIRMQGSPDKVEEAIVRAATLDGKSCRIDIPQDPGQAGKSQILYLTKALQGFKVVSSTDSGDKITRAEPFASQVNVGAVAMTRAEWNFALIHELRNFPFAKHDDQVDALSRGFAQLIVTNSGDEWAGFYGAQVKKLGAKTA